VQSCQIQFLVQSNRQVQSSSVQSPGFTETRPRSCHTCF